MRIPLDVKKEIKTMCDNFKKLRLRKGCPLAEVSRDTGIREGLLKALENGISPAGFYAEELVTLCQYYGLEHIDDIFYPME